MFEHVRTPPDRLLATHTRAGVIASLAQQHEELAAEDEPCEERTARVLPDVDDREAVVPRALEHGDEIAALRAKEVVT